jgi:hypothetical protein
MPSKHLGTCGCTRSGSTACNNTSPTAPVTSRVKSVQAKPSQVTPAREWLGGACLREHGDELIVGEEVEAREGEALALEVDLEPLERTPQVPVGLTQLLKEQTRSAHAQHRLDVRRIVLTDVGSRGTSMGSRRVVGFDSTRLQWAVGFDSTRLLSPLSCATWRRRPRSASPRRGSAAARRPRRRSDRERRLFTAESRTDARQRHGRAAGGGGVVFGAVQMRWQSCHSSKISWMRVRVFDQVEIRSSKGAMYGEPRIACLCEQQQHSSTRGVMYPALTDGRAVEGGGRAVGGRWRAAGGQREGRGRAVRGE